MNLRGRSFEKRVPVKSMVKVRAYVSEAIFGEGLNYVMKYKMVLCKSEVE